jgi:hypothetical protein
MTRRQALKAAEENLRIVGNYGGGVDIRLTFNLDAMADSNGLDR